MPFVWPINKLSTLRESLQSQCCLSLSPDPDSALPLYVWLGECLDLAVWGLPVATSACLTWEVCMHPLLSLQRACNHFSLNAVCLSPLTQTLLCLCMSGQLRYISAGYGPLTLTSAQRRLFASSATSTSIPSWHLRCLR
jgi:hypothetical protein